MALDKAPTFTVTVLDVGVAIDRFALQFPARSHCCTKQVVEKLNATSTAHIYIRSTGINLSQQTGIKTGMAGWIICARTHCCVTCNHVMSNINNINITCTCRVRAHKLHARIIEFGSRTEFGFNRKSMQQEVKIK